MKKFARRLLIASTLVGFLSVGGIAEAGLGDFFKKLGHSMTKPQPRERQRPPVRKSAARPSNTSAKNADKRHQSPAQDLVEKNPETPQSQPTPADLATAPAPIQQPAVRVAASIPPATGKRRDIPFGIPVPNKTGFVTSPYAPNQGLVDVRGFPSGTEVKDPYTNKIFLTP